MIGILLAAALTAQVEMRSWSDETGKHSVEAKYIAGTETVVTLEKADGSRIDAPLSRLSRRDRIIARAYGLADEDLRLFFRLVFVHQELQEKTNLRTTEYHKDEIKKAKRSRTPNRRLIAAHEQSLKELEGQGKLIEAGTWLPEVNLHELQLGSAGLLLYPMRIIQIIGPDTCRASGAPDGTAFLLKGLPTNGFVDDQIVQPTGAVMVTGTTKYETAIGGSKTVYLVKWIDSDRIVATMKALAAP